MPKVKAVDPLFSLCVDLINSILQNISIPVNIERTIEQTTDSDTESNINPFQSLPTALLEVIISSLPISKTATKHFNIEFLITTGLKKLIFPRFYCFKNEQYLSFFPKLEKLQVLVLENSNADNTCLKLIGKWCKKLRVLNVDGCSRLSDIGVEWLVLQTPEMSKTLQEFRISCPGITKLGTKILVQHFPALQVVLGFHTFKVLLEIAQSAELDSSISFNTCFTRLIINSSSPYTAGNIELVTKYSPLLSDLTFVVSVGLTDTDLFCLTNLKNLEKLKFYADPNSNEDEITFDKGLAPVLKVIGSSLQVLGLQYFEFADIWTVVKFCPNLISLSFENQCQSLSVLSADEIIQLRNEKGRYIFKDLKSLGCGFNLSDDILFDLLSCPSLEFVYLTLCDALTEGFLKEALSRDLFKNLKILKLDSCKYVTKKGLDELVMNDNNLERISLYYCHKVTRAHVYDWHIFARQKNWKLYLSCENFETELVSYY